MTPQSLDVIPVPTRPEIGQVVEVRGSTWAVVNVTPQGLPRDPADESDRTARLSHVIELQSLDEGRLGETLSVVWELEVGQTVTPAKGLPSRRRWLVLWMRCGGVR